MAGKRPHDKAEKQAGTKPQVDEKAYKAALEKIPEPKEKYDPWSGRVRRNRPRRSKANSVKPGHDRAKLRHLNARVDVRA